MAFDPKAAFAGILKRLKLPVIAAPMFRVSGPDLVMAACNAGIIGAFPTANARSLEQLEEWLRMIRAGIGPGPDGCVGAPFCPNLIIRDPRLESHLACLLEHRPEMVITSVGSPAGVVDRLHEVGCLVFADVGSLKHARQALQAGADGLVLLSAGAGGNTGWLNPFAFVREVRGFFDGPLVLAGGLIDGVALRAMIALGCDLAYAGTRFIAARESMAVEPYKDMLVASSMDDVMVTKAFSGLQSSMLRPSIINAGLDPDNLVENLTPQQAREVYGAVATGGPQRWKDIWSAGHSVSGVTHVASVQEIVDELARSYLGCRSI
jgi:nitronate monooxygenase